MVVVNNPTAIKRRILAIIPRKKRENMTIPQNPKLKRKNIIPQKKPTIMITLVKNLIKTPLKKKKSMMMTITNPSLMIITNPSLMKITNPSLMTITNPSMGVVAATKRKPITKNTKRKTPMIMRVVATKKRAIMMIMRVATKRKATMIIMGAATKRKTHPMPKNHIMTTKNHFMFSW